MNLNVKGLFSGYGRRAVIKGISFNVSEGDFLCILGPNGAGKTTLFKTLLGFINPYDGEVSFSSDDSFDWSKNNRAKKIAYIPQSHAPLFNYRVLDFVVMGRTPHLGAFGMPGEEDEEIALESLATLGIEHLKDRGYATLSGGERQLVQIAKALAQKAEVFVMDEPTSNLDFGNQHQVLHEVRRLVERGYIVVMTSHNPNHALLFSNKALLLKDGEVVSFGETGNVVNEETLREIYSIDVKIVDVEHNGSVTKMCLPLNE